MTPRNKIVQLKHHFGMSVGILLVIFSFILPSDFNSFVSNNFVSLLYNENIVVYFLSFLLIALVIILSILSKYKVAISCSFLFLIIQIFPDVYYYVTTIFVNVLWLHLVFLLLAIANVHLYFSKQINTKIKRILSIPFFLIVLLYLAMSFFPMLDGFPLFLLFLFITYFLYHSIFNISFKVVRMLFLVYYLLSLGLMFFLLDCNFQIIGDVLSHNWTLKSIWNRCSGFILCTIGAIIINFFLLMLLKVKNANIWNSKSPRLPREQCH